MERSGRPVLIALALALGLSAPASAQDDVPVAVEVASLREPLLRIESSRFKRARADSVVLGGLAAGQITAGVVLWFQDHGAAYPLVAGGLAASAATFGLIDLAGRRKRALDARFSELEGKPEGAWLALVEDRRRLADKHARTAAFTSGIYAGLAAAGAAAFLGLDEPFAEQAGLGVATLGLIGALHHGGRWRSHVRAAGDIALVPMRVPEP